MIYEAQVAYNASNNKGEIKCVKENYLMENRLIFAQVESDLYGMFNGYSNIEDFDVVAIKRSKIKEIANTRGSDEDLLWLAEIEDIFLTDDGEEKPLRYKIVVFAPTFDSAKAFLADYLKQGYSMELVSLKLTKFKDLIK